LQREDFLRSGGIAGGVPPLGLLLLPHPLLRRRVDPGPGGEVPPAGGARGGGQGGGEEAGVERSGKGFSTKDGFPGASPSRPTRPPAADPRSLPSPQRLPANPRGLNGSGRLLAPPELRFESTPSAGHLHRAGGIGSFGKREVSMAFHLLHWAERGNSMK